MFQELNKVSSHFGAGVSSDEYFIVKTDSERKKQMNIM